MYERIEAEESLIGCLLSDNNSIEKVYGILSPEMFDSGVLGAAYHEYRKAFDEKRSLTIVELKQRLDAIGYKDYEINDSLMKAATSGSMSFQISGFANAILAHWKKRQIDKILGNTEISEADVDGQIDKLIGDLDGLRGGSVSKGHTVAEIANQYSEDYFCDKDKKLILLGDEMIDNMTGGFQGGDLCVCGARPSVGKSALATQWAEQLAGQGYKVGYYNLEMQNRALYERFIASKSGIETTRIRLAKAFLNDEKERYQRAVEELKKQENIIIFTGAKKISEIRNDVREYKFSVIIIDYIQLVTPDSRYQGNRTAEVSEISRDCKNIAMDYDCVVLALTQLNRASEGRSDRRPTMADIRESGSIEQDASIIFLMWQGDEQDRSKKDFEVVKSRNGRTGRADFIFDGAHLRFSHEQAATPFD